MKIAVWHNLPSGGGKRALFDHVSGLIVRGHEVEVWAPPTADREYLPLSSIVREHIVALDHRWKWTGAERLQLALYKERQIRAMDEHCAQCAQEMDEGGFDLLFANSCQFYRTTSIGRFSKLPTILYLQEPYRWLYEAIPENRWAARSGDRGHGWQAVKRAFADWREVRNARVQVREEITNAKAFDRILCNSYFSRESILRAYGVDARVCYLGINTKLFKPRGAPRGHVIGLGSFTREKGLELCVRAIARISPRRPPLVWVGNHVDQAYFDEVRKLAVELDVAFEPRVLVADDELLDL